MPNIYENPDMMAPWGGLLQPQATPTPSPTPTSVSPQQDMLHYFLSLLMKGKDKVMGTVLPRISTDRTPTLEQQLDTLQKRSTPTK